MCKAVGTILYSLRDNNMHAKYKRITIQKDKKELVRRKTMVVRYWGIILNSLMDLKAADKIVHNALIL